MMKIYRMGELKRRVGGMAARLVEPRNISVLVKGWILYRSRLMHRSWYLQTTGEKRGSNLKLACRIAGSSEGGQPSINPLFDADWYRLQSGYEGSSADALVHYILWGERAGFRPNPWFDPAHFKRYCSSYGGRGTRLAAYWNNWQAWPHAHPHFDSHWYRWQYRDSGGDRRSPLGGHPLASFLHQGINLGHQPNAYLLPRRAGPGLSDATGGLESASRYLDPAGSGEFFDPAPAFNVQAYASGYPDYRASGLDPLGHYLTIGRTQGKGTGTSRLALYDLDESRSSTARIHSRRQPSVALMVNAGPRLEPARACLEAIFASKNRTRLRVIVISDPAVEKELADYLFALARARRITLVEKPAHSRASAAMEALGDGDAAPSLVIFDGNPIVSGDWLDRLGAHASRHPSAGMITALSATAGSSTTSSIRLWRGCSAPDMARIAAEVNSGMCVELRDAELDNDVRTCTLLTRKFIDAARGSTQATPGQAFGNLMPCFPSAAPSGCLHLLALDVLVGFADECIDLPACRDHEVAAEGRGETFLGSLNQLRMLTPSAPLLAAQLRMTLARWRAGGRQVMAIITHDVGGGTERQVLRICKEMENTHHVLIFRPGDGHDSLIRVENPIGYDSFSALIDVVDGEGFARLLTMSGVSSIQLHHLYNHGSTIREGLARSGIPFTFHVHDYYVICPQITLTTPDRNYCGEPERTICDACIAGRPAHGSTDIRNWRDAQEWAVLNASAVVTPSHDAADRLRRYFDIVPTVAYHEPHPAIAVTVARSHPVDADNPLRVVLIGALSAIKGRGKVFEAAAVGHARRLPIAFHLIGHTENEPVPDIAGGFTMTGEYLEHDLPNLLEQARPDMFLFASAAPETYAFTLTAAMRTGHPILATDLGAFRERLANYPRAELYPHMMSGEQLAGKILSFARTHLPAAFPVRAQ